MRDLPPLYSAILRALTEALRRDTVVAPSSPERYSHAQAVMAFSRHPMTGATGRHTDGATG